jgi:hypothetical protein
MAAQWFYVDGFGFEQVSLHEVFLSIPSVRYTDKAEEPGARDKQPRTRKAQCRHRLEKESEVGISQAT